MVEQGTHNPLVLGSNPGGPTKNNQAVAYKERRPFLYCDVGKLQIKASATLVSP